MAEKIEDVIIKLELSVNSVNIVLGALGEVSLPFKVSSPIIAAITEQGQAQVREWQAANPEVEEVHEGEIVD